MDKVMRKQAGFGLVELMIALVLSLIVVGGLYAALIGDQKSYEATRANHLLVNKNRMTAQTLRLYIQQAGYRAITQLETNQPLLAVTTADSSGYTWVEGQLIQGLNNQTSFNGAKEQTDVLSFRFFGDSGIYQCNGEELSANTVLTMSFFISTSNQLMCRDSESVNDTVFDDNVDDFQVLYGRLDHSSDGDSFKYYTADNVTDWDQINRVKVGLLISQEVTMGNLTNAATYKVLDQNIAAFNDKKLRQVVSETVLLLNTGV